MRALITGVTGFVGSHLAEYLLANGYEVYGTVRWRSRYENIEHIKNKIKLIESDIRDAYSIKKAIDESQPDFIFHLAAQSFVLTSFHAPQETLTTNIVGTVNILEAVRASNIDPKIHIAGSSEEYGLVYPNETPIKETNPLRPMSPYGISKVAEEMLGFQYYKSYGIKTVVTRAFNHSVSEWTPVIIRNSKTGLIDIKYIREIRKAREKSGTMGKYYQQWNLDGSDLQVWANNKFTDLKSISAHKLQGHHLLRFISSGGIVEVTDNHSVIDTNMKSVNAGELKIGNRVKIVDLPNNDMCYVPEDVAWFFGFFVAEGDCKFLTHPYGKSVFRVSNKNKKLLKRVQDILLKYFAKDSVIRNEKNCFRLYVLSPQNLAYYFYKEFYAPDGNKRVPKIILNSSKEIKMAFLKGFNDGDGLKDGHRSVMEFKNFKTKSRILALGLCYLIKNTTGQRFTLNFEDRNEDYFSINLNSIGRGTMEGQHLKKPHDTIKKIQKVVYNSFVYDLETEDHVFHGGAGGNLLHNTGPRRGDVFVTSNFSKQITEIEKGLKEPVIYVGNLNSQRDFTDVRDVVRAYELCLKKCDYGEVYNVCSSRAWKIKDVLDLLLTMSKVKIKIEQDPSRMRPSDVEILLGDFTKFRQKTGWEPKIPFEKTMQDLINYWRERV